MESIYEFMRQLVNPESIIQYGGIYLLLFVVFAETGLFVGFFLPGDSLLFTAGLLCATRVLQIHIVFLVLLIILGAVLGNISGYAFGKRVGIRLFKRESTLFFKQKHLISARKFYSKYGGKTIFFCRFLPVVRTFAPIVAGIVKLDYRKFLFYNLLGATCWVCSLVLCGYFLGIYVPEVKFYLEYIIIFLIVITSIPLIISSLKKKHKLAL
ncbi:MAG: VTT domain-containing protein [Bacteroidota bacterium]|nr:VTT domain-containing protein [Bacteroidota bacterium]MDP4274834.1 VTT domain-containing protein [Bacteroidota bacterium]